MTGFRQPPVFRLSRQARVPHLIVSFLLCLVITLAGGERAGAAGGGLDPAFNPGGAGANGVVDAVAVQPDGKVLIAGRFTSYNGNSAAGNYITRLNPNGTLDTTFNPGRVGANGFVLAIAVQPDGKIIVGGQFNSYNGNAAVSDGLTRLNPNGTLDTTFNPGGAGADNNVWAVAVQPDGKILVGGRFYTYNGTASEGIARLNSDGTLDASFNPAGSGAHNLRAIAVQPDGKILIGGDFVLSSSTPGSMGKVTRLNSDGTRDASFNPGGAGADGVVNAVALQPNGKILIGGSFTMYNGDAAIPDKIARLNANGTRDTTFNPGGAGPDGFVSRYPTVDALALQPDGRVVIGGEFTSYNGDAAASDCVMRLNSNGTPDASFNAGGAGANEIVRAVALQADGKVLIGGDFTSFNGDGAGPDHIARLLAATGDIAFSTASQSVAETAANAAVTLTRTGGTDNKVVAKVTLSDGTTAAAADYRAIPGALDTTFNPGGAGANFTVWAVAVQPDGRVVIAGQFTSYNGNSAASNHILRLNSNGTLDPTFNSGGAGTDFTVWGVAVQPDGKILIAGDFTSYNGNSAAPDRIARLNPNGTLDTSFNPGGAGAENSVTAVAVQPDKKIIIGGQFTSYNGDSAAADRIIRLNPNGTLDTSFNPGGAGSSGSVTTVALQPDGKIIIGGFFQGYNGDYAVGDCVARLNTDGTLDTSFNPGGAGADSDVFAAAVQPDGKVIIAGQFTSYNGDFAARDYIARLKTDGTLDPTFNPGGAGADNFVYGVALQPDGKIIIAGSFQNYNGNAAASDFVARLNANGTLDPSFNPGGAGTYGGALAVAVQPDGKIVIAGDFTGHNGDFAASDRIARLGGDLFVTWPAGDAANKTVLLPIVNDAVYEGDETLNLALSIIAGGAGLGAPATSELTIVDNEAPPKLSVDSVTVAEGNSGTVNAVFTVKLSGAASKPVTVEYQTANATATAPTDYTAVPPTTLTFAPGQTSKTVTVAVKGDLIDEVDETFKLSLSSPTVATIAAGLGTGVCTIKDDDAAAISINNVSVTEPDSGAVALTFTVKLSLASSRTVTVKYQTADGTATAPADYTAKALTTLSFSAGQTSKTVTVAVRGDLVKEPNETLFLNLSAPVNATIADSQGLGTILNDD